MIAVSRWNEYDVNATTGYTAAKDGNRAYTAGDGTNKALSSYTIDGTNNQLRLTLGASSRTVTVASGTALDPRFIALDIQRKVQEQYAFVAAADQDSWQNAKCEYTNGRFIIWSGDVEAAEVCELAAVSNDIYATIGFDTEDSAVGAVGTNGYTGTVTITGTYTGQFDDVYSLIATKESNYNAASVTTGSYSGTVTLGGDWNLNETRTYTLTIDTTNGSTMGGGNGLVPTMAWENDNHTDDSGVGEEVELLYPDYWYDVGTKGFRVKFSDDVFDGTGSGGIVEFQFTTNPVQYTSGTNTSDPVGTAMFITRSRRGDDTAAQATSQTPVAFGTQGLSVSWTATDTIDAGDQWDIFCRAIAPTSDDAGITTVNYGNVTVSTDSAVKVVQFEIMSGAVLMDSLKFGLNDNGGFQHHDAGSNDTFVHFATVGAANPDDAGNEWESGITATEISPSSEKVGGSTGSPTDLWAAKKNLSVVSSADDSEPVGNTGLISDFIFLGIKLGASETSANTVTYRIFYDFS